jgi:hypothetical protein
MMRNKFPPFSKRKSFPSGSQGTLDGIPGPGQHLHQSTPRIDKKKAPEQSPGRKSKNKSQQIS